jgi:gas vesicle protein
MEQRNAYLFGTMAGAAVGALAGYLFLTRRGRQTLAGARQLVAQIAGEIERARPLWYKMRLAIEEYRERDFPATYDVDELLQRTAPRGTTS